jgi:hypothetical protein
MPKVLEPVRKLKLKVLEMDCRLVDGNTTFASEAIGLENFQRSKTENGNTSQKLCQDLLATAES